MKKIIFSAITLLTVSALFAFTTLQNWKIKETHQISFSSNEVNGVFKTFTGTIAFDAKDLAKSKFDLTIDVASINTGNGLMNKHAKGDDWFNAEKFPSINFTSSKIEKSGTDFKAIGTLEMHGIKKDFTVPFSFKKNIFKANFSVNRIDFKVGKAGNDVSSVLKIDAIIPVTKK